MRSKRIVHMRVLPGEPTDGTGRICVHLFVADTKGSFTEAHVLHPVIKDGVVVKKQYEAKATCGRLACDSKRSPAPFTVKGVTTVTPRTDDPRAATCPKCKASADYTRLMSKLEG